VGERVATIRAALAEGVQDGRMAWATLFGHDPSADEGLAYAVGSIHQALLSGVLVQWLIDPDSAPSAADLTLGLRTIAADVTG
jgi:hypothetical protein